MIAIKFNSAGEYESHCMDYNITSLEEIQPNGEGFEFYELTLEQLDDVSYLILKDGIVCINTAKKQSEAESINKAKEMQEKRIRLTALSEDIIQSLAGETVPNLQERRQEFITLHNELRKLEGKEKREINLSII